MTNSTSNERPAYVWNNDTPPRQDAGSMFKHALAFERLIEHLRKTEPEAAGWLDTVLRHAEGFVPVGNLDFALEWCETPQGDDFWQRVHSRLTQEGYYCEENFNTYRCYRDNE